MKFLTLSKNKGFTLVEVLVAMLIASIIFLAIIRLFSRVGEMFDENAATMQLMETTRIAMKFVRGDLVQAGYLGCIMTDIDTTKTTMSHRFGPTITGTNIDDNLLGIWGNDGPSGTPDSLSLFYQQDLDIRVLFADTSAAYGNSPALFVDAVNVFNAGQTVIDQGDWLVASNCAYATVFMLTNTPVELSESAYSNIHPGITANGTVTRLEYASSVSYDGYSNANSDQIDKGKFGFSAGGGAGMVSRFVQVTYQVAPSEIDGGETDSLYRLVNGASISKENEMIRLVEDFQVEYGIDEDADGVVDRFDVTFDSQNDSIVMVKVLVKIKDSNRTTELENVVKLRNKGL